MTPNTIFLKLLKMRNGSGKLLFRRLTMTQELISNKGWVKALEFGGGDEGRALDRLESECFGDICGAMSLPNMLSLLRAIPSEKTWQANKYNLKKMWLEMIARKPKTKRKKDMEAKDKKIVQLTAQLDQAKEEVKEWKARCHDLNSEVKALKAKLKDANREAKRVFAR